MTGFASVTVSSWDELQQRIPRSANDWIYRGQVADFPLSTTLERASRDAGLGTKHNSVIESHLIRNFRRRYDGPDRNYALLDTLYCMSLMQHHGAPTRFLDLTYSPYVAAFFALQSAPSAKDDLPVLWCFNRHWFNREIRRITQQDYLNTDDISDERSIKESEEKFLRFYKSDGRYRFVGLKDSFLLHSRIKIQQGIFLCQSDVSVSIGENLQEMNEWQSSNAILKVQLSFSVEERWRALNELHSMNINEESLFPGLDGFCRSLKHRLRYLLVVAHDANTKADFALPDFSA